MCQGDGRHVGMRWIRIDQKPHMTKSDLHDQEDSYMFSALVYHSLEESSFCQNIENTVLVLILFFTVGLYPSFEMGNTYLCYKRSWPLSVVHTSAVPDQRILLSTEYINASLQATELMLQVSYHILFPCVTNFIICISDAEIMQW